MISNTIGRFHINSNYQFKRKPSLTLPVHFIIPWTNICFSQEANFLLIIRSFHMILLHFEASRAKNSFIKLLCWHPCLNSFLCYLDVPRKRKKKRKASLVVVKKKRRYDKWLTKCTIILNFFYIVKIAYLFGI